MKEFFNSLFMTPVPEQGKRALLFMPLIALPALLIFLGVGELTGVESEWAACWRIISDGGKYFAPWMPKHYNSMIFGRIINELSAVFPISEWLIRIPAVLAALAALAGTILLALKIFDRKNAIFAGWLMLSSCGFLYWGRVGNNAMFAAAASAWCATLFYGRMRSKAAPFRRSFNFFLLLLLTFFGCGLTAVAGIIVLLLPRWIIQIKKRQFKVNSIKWAAAGLLSAAALIGAVLCLAVYYGKAENFRFDDLFFIGEFLHDSAVSAWHDFITPGEYSIVPQFPYLSVLLLPWSLFIPAAAYGLWKKRGELPVDLKALVCGMGLFILCIGVFPSRSWETMLPLLGPAVIAISAGLSVRYHDANWEAVSELIVRVIFIIIAALATALLCTWPLWNVLLQLQPPVLLMVISTAVGAAALTVLTFCTVSGSFAERLTKRPAPLAGTVLAGVILSVLVNCVILPQMSLFATERAFWQTSANMLEQCDPTPEVVMLYRCGLPEQGIYYLIPRQRIEVVTSPADADKLLQNCGGKVAVITRHSPEYLAELQVIARKNRKNFFPDRPLCKEDLPTAFTSGAARSPDNRWGTWLLEL